MTQPAVSDAQPDSPSRVLIAGGGVAAIETAAALADLAGGLVQVSLLAPDTDLVYRPALVHEPFGVARRERYPLAKLTAALGASLISDTFGWVDRGERIVHTDSGAELGYEALVLCLGARARPSFPHALTIADDGLAALQMLVDDVKQGRVRDVVFIVPERMAWPLPLYELAIMIAELGERARQQPTLTFLTAEPEPLSVFGRRVSREVTTLLLENEIQVASRVRCTVPEPGRVLVSSGSQGGFDRRPREVRADRVVALPELFGPHARGIPGSADGFIAVDSYCRVRGAPHIHAAGDATDFPVKHGGIAVQQADTAAAVIAAEVGAPVEAGPLHAKLQGTLLTARGARYVSAQVVGGRPYDSYFSDQPSWVPATKIVSWRLAAYLEAVAH